MKEENKINDGGPAFPCNSPDGLETYKGMTLRDWLAGMFCGHVAHDWSESDQKHKITIAANSYEFADAMIAERNKA